MFSFHAFFDILTIVLRFNVYKITTDKCLKIVNWCLYSKNIHDLGIWNLFDYLVKNFNF